MDLTNSLEDDLENLNSETITLKKPNEVYYQLYKEAREKAKTAKKIAIIAYLEAKNIKKTYMIESLDESESDIDAEIDEVSESELDGL
jgi:rRNA-processing protein FCF1